MARITEQLKEAKFQIEFGNHILALASLGWALKFARQLPADVPRNRCLRAYIAQAIGALDANT